MRAGAESLPPWLVVVCHRCHCCMAEADATPTDGGQLFAYIAADGTVAAAVNAYLGIAVRVEKLQSTLQAVFTAMQTLQNCRNDSPLSTLAYYVRFVVTRAEYFLFQSSYFTSLPSVITSSFGSPNMADWR